MSNKRVLIISASSFSQLVVLVLILGGHVSTAQWKEQSLFGLGPLVKKNQRSTVLSTEYGDVAEARLTDGNEAFQLHFITLEPNSLFLPVLLHYDMVFYVQTGSGRLSYLDEYEKEHRRLRQGDVHRLRSGAVFFIQSDLDNERQKLRVIAIFDNPEYDFNEPASGPYSSVSDLVLGFDERVLRAIFKAPVPLVEEIRHATRPAAIIHALQQQKKNTMLQETEYEFMEDMYNIFDLSNKHKKSKLFNINDKDPDFKNDNGWSTIVDKKKYGPLKGSKYGVFMVYLTEGSMMGQHWNPVATEVAVAVKGKGMIHVVCSRMMDTSKCNDSRFLVEPGDAFVVPRFHAMAQMAFDNETFVFMGFSTSTGKNHPQYLAGKASVPRTLDKHIMAASLGINVSTFDKLWDKQDKSVILDCTSCAEEEWMRLLEEIEKERLREEEEARKREKEKRREEEAARKREEEEIERKKEEEAQKKREEAAWRRWAEEERKRQEEQEREKQEQQQREQEEKERQEQQQKQKQEEREKQEQQLREQEKERQEQQRRWEEEESKRREQQQKQEQEERERQEQQQQQEQEEWAAREREQEKAQEAERETEAQAKREEEAAKEQEEEAAKGQAQWGEGQEEQEEKERQEQQQQEERERQEQEQEEWTDKKREQEQAQAQEAERRRKAQARSKKGAAEEEDVAAQGQGQEQWREDQEGQVSQEKTGHEAEARWWEEAHGRRGRGQQESETSQEEQGGAQKWARRILNNIA